MRYAGVLSLGTAYAGTSDAWAVRKLLSISATEVFRTCPRSRAQCLAWCWSSTALHWWSWLSWTCTVRMSTWGGVLAWPSALPLRPQPHCRPSRCSNPCWATKRAWSSRAPTSAWAWYSTTNLRVTLRMTKCRLTSRRSWTKASAWRPRTHSPSLAQCLQLALWTQAAGIRNSSSPRPRPTRLSNPQWLVLSCSCRCSIGTLRFHLYRCVWNRNVW